MKQLESLVKRAVPALLLLLCSTLYAQAQGNGIDVRGTVVDNAGEPLIGASVIVKGNASQGTVTDFDGNFQLKVPSEQTVLVVSYVGMNTKELRVGKQRTFNVVLSDNTQLTEVIVVGYGQQKKASVVGAITQTTGEVLERAAGISDIGSALTVTCLVSLRCLLQVCLVRKSPRLSFVVLLHGTTPLRWCLWMVSSVRCRVLISSR